MEPNYRRCISCRQLLPKKVLWRIVRVYPSRQVQLDEGMGRSAYLCPQASCLAAAKKKNRLGRALRVSVPESLYGTLWQRLAPKSVTPEANLEGETNHQELNTWKVNRSNR